MDAVFYKGNENDFLLALQNVNFAAPTAVQFSMDSAYMKSYYKNLHDFSFLLIDRGMVVAVVPCHVVNEKLCFNDRGIDVYHGGLDRRKAKKILETLSAAAAESGSSEIVLNDHDVSREISFFGYEAYKAGAVPKMVLTADVDLTLNDAEIHRGVRDSYRSLVNQGRREMEVRYITRENLSRSEFDQFQDLHLRAAGRITRSQESWDSQYKMIESGCAELVVAYMEEYGMVSAALFCDYADITIYASAAYNRDLFEKPLAHVVVYDAIYRAKKRGQKKFFLGVLSDTKGVTQKEASISKFKKGFCDRPSCFVEWVINPVPINKGEL